MIDENDNCWCNACNTIGVTPHKKGGHAPWYSKIRTYYISYIYWPLRLSKWSRPYFAIKTFIFLLLHARETAECLDDCMRIIGSQMNHLPMLECKHCCSKLSPDTSVMTLKIDARSNLFVSYKVLPSWKWR